MEANTSGAIIIAFNVSASNEAKLLSNETVFEPKYVFLTLFFTFFHFFGRRFFLYIFLPKPYKTLSLTHSLPADL